jgi:hypothetical protein
LSQRDSMIVARHEVPGVVRKIASVPAGRLNDIGLDWTPTYLSTEYLAFLNLENWSQRPGSWVISIWWILFLLYYAVTQVSLGIAIQASTNDQWTLAAVLAIAGDFFSIPLSITALRLVTEVYRRQRALVEGVNSSDH